MLALIFSVCSMALALGGLLIGARAFVLTRRSAPNQIMSALQELSERVIAAEDNLRSHDARAMQWRTEMDGLIESAEDVLDRVERKRRSTAASASKIKSHEQAGPAPGSEAELHARAVAQGLM